MSSITGRFAMSALCGALLAPCAAGAETFPLDNPSFEKGTGGYWLNRPALASIDGDESTQGARSLRFDLPGGKSVDTVFYIPSRTGETWTLEFDAKAEGEPLLQLKVMLHGEKPVCFWTPDKGTKALAELHPEGKWTRMKCVFGPLPAKAMGKDVGKAAVYLSISSDAPAKLWLDNLAISSAPGEAADAAKPAPRSAPKPSAKPDAPKTVETKSKKTPPDAGSLTLSLPGDLKIYEKPVEISLSCKASLKEGSLIRLRLLDFRDRQLLDETANAGGTVRAQIGKPGYYKAEAILETDGAAVEMKTSSFMIAIPLPDDFYSTPEPAFGVWCGVDWKLLKLAGAKWTRQLFFTQFQKPDFKGDAPSAQAIASKNPIKVIKCLNVLSPFKKMTAVPQDAWSGLLDKTGKEITASKGLIDVWETQNEPMVGENFHGSMADVVDIISNESRLIRKIAPGMPIAGICINPMSANQYGQIIGYYRNFAMDRLIDAVMIHPYIPNAAAPDSSGYPEMLARLSRDLKEITGRDVPIYISEIGYSTKPGGEVSELEQAAYIARVALINRGFPNLKACVWHCGLWNDAGSRRELDYGILRPHPKGSPIREPKPAFAAMATMARQTYDASYLGELEFGRGAKALLFSRKGLPLIVAYSLSKTPKTLKIPLSGGKASITDLCGTPSETNTENGLLTITVDEAPVYISGGGADDIARLNGLKVEFSPQELKVKPGHEAVISMKGAPLAEAGVSLKVETPAGWTAETAGAGDHRTVKLKIPANASPGEQSFYIHLVKDGGSRRIWNREVAIQAPIELEGVECSPSGDDHAVALRFIPKSERNDAAFKLNVFEDAKKLASGEFRTGGQANMKIPQPAFGRPHQYTAEIDDGLRKPWTVRLPALNRFQISQRMSKFSIGNGAPSRGSVEGAFDKPQGTVSLGWSEKALLVSVETKDKWFETAKTLESMWNGDSLQIGVAVPQSEMIHANNDGIQETAFTSFGLMPSEGGVCKSWVWASSNRNLAELSVPLPGVDAKWTREGDTTRYEASIPWASLNVKAPRPGLELKFSLLINDADESKQRHWVEWYGGIASGMDVSLYGDAVLAK